MEGLMGELLMKFAALIAIVLALPTEEKTTQVAVKVEEPKEVAVDASLAREGGRGNGGRGNGGRGNGGRGNGDRPNCRGKVVSGGYSDMDRCREANNGRCKPVINCAGDIVWIPSSTVIFG
jgi:hypothetical protein